MAGSRIYLTAEFNPVLNKARQAFGPQNDASLLLSVGRAWLSLQPTTADVQTASHKARQIDDVIAPFLAAVDRGFSEMTAHFSQLRAQSLEHQKALLLLIRAIEESGTDA